jgi:hypothetical protein
LVHEWKYPQILETIRSNNPEMGKYFFAIFKGNSAIHWNLSNYFWVDLTW